MPCKGEAARFSCFFKNKPRASAWYLSEKRPVYSGREVVDFPSYCLEFWGDSGESSKLPIGYKITLRQIVGQGFCGSFLQNLPEIASTEQAGVWRFWSAGPGQGFGPLHAPR